MADAEEDGESGFEAVAIFVHLILEQSHRDQIMCCVSILGVPHHFFRHLARAKISHPFLENHQSR